VSFGEWISAPVNWVFLIVGFLTLFSAVKVVTAKNVVHAALFLVAALGGTAIVFLMLSAEFVAWVVVLVYIGAVLVLFLFGIMITRAPTGKDVGLDSPNKLWPALLSGAMFLLLGWASLDAFGTTEIVDLGEATSTEVLGLALLGRFVIPFEVVSFILLAALIGGVTIARRDLSPLEEEQRGAV
jgi:NADH-quinone oxidoreductase subunit J